MLDFTVNHQACTRCGECVADCPAHIIAMADDGYPNISTEQEASCYKCQHCLTVCPTGAVSILGLKPEESIPLADNYPRPDQLETLMKGRRSVRRYRDENVEPELLQRLLEVAWHAPTGVNSRQVRLTVVDDRGTMAKLRDEVLAGLGQLVLDNALPEKYSFYADFVRVWEGEKRDVIFRGAPHLLVASAPQDVPCPMQDCLIALSYFELFAQANGVGTVWCGLAKYAIDDILPGTRTRLGIPDDHVIGYAMLFGMPTASFARTAQHRPALIHRVE
jgi:nitroreductase/NAD-dependent dihydropyrimidine dehydrogenase PreA subunit